MGTSRQPSPPMMSQHEVAEYFSVTGRTVQRWMKERQIPFSRIGRLVRFSQRDVIKFQRATCVETGKK
jgi:excisionase family DNA binding protein